VIVLGIDPSDTRHAWALYDSKHNLVRNFGRDFLVECSTAIWSVDLVAVEMVASYGMAAGATLFDTCVEIGRLLTYIEKFYAFPRRITRTEVKLAICGQARAKDSNVRQALIDMWGGKEATKKGGPLHGVAADTWAALAVAVAAAKPGVKWYVRAAGRAKQ
jgi:Holliday junction resolvasome RuvABC endonuclease subunit